MFKTLTPVISIITAITLFLFFTKPMYAEIQLVQEETAQYEEAVAKAEELNMKLQELLRRKNSFSLEQLERLDKLVPNTTDEVHLLVDLESLAKEHKVYFGNIEVNKGEESEASEIEDVGQISGEDSFSSVDISFDIIGTYEQFRDFLDDIEQSLVLMEIIKIDFTALDGDLQQYKIAIRTYAITESTLEIE